MTLDQLRVFIAVAERGHLTRAAEALNLSPSAVSAAIQALEIRYDVRLFDRIGRRIALSATGREFLDEAKATARSAAAAELALRELAGLRRGTLTIRASQTIASYWLPPFVIAFKTAHPGIEVRLHEGNSAEVSVAVLEGTVDLGFAEGEIRHPSLAVRPLIADRIVIAGRPDHPLTRKPTVSGDDLLADSWILRETGSGTRSAFEAALRGHGLEPDGLQIIQAMPTNEAACAAVRASPHLTAVSSLVVRPHVDAGRLAVVPFDLGTRDFRLVRHRERYRTKASKAFEALVASPAASAP